MLQASQDFLYGIGKAWDCLEPWQYSAKQGLYPDDAMVLEDRCAQLQEDPIQARREVLAWIQMHCRTTLSFTLKEYSQVREYVLLRVLGESGRYREGVYSLLGEPEMEAQLERYGWLDAPGSINFLGDWYWDSEQTSLYRLPDGGQIYSLSAFEDRPRWQRLRQVYDDSEQGTKG